MAHPRSRGEHRTRRERASRAPGSSPLTRGARCSPGGGLGRFRLIPAHAGSTLSISALGKDARAHPRSRGEHSITSGLVVPPFGSSPLTRGARPSLRKHGVTPRLIPAHAGSTTNLRTVRRESEAHPRSRGEHGGTRHGWCPRRGSSPLTRGARRSRPSRFQQRGLIPAHAGSTRGQGEAGAHARAHPRSRGEHDDAGGVFSTVRGSSPLTRGARRRIPMSGISDGLIPAHAGSTSRWQWLYLRIWAHPRSRGEHTGPRLTPFALHGSSPLTRGARGANVRVGVGTGLIPAHAGSTQPL